MRLRLPSPGRLLLAVLIGVGLGSVLATENALHIQHREITQPQVAIDLARSSASDWRDVQVEGRPAATLRGWMFTPHAPNGSAVILLHGVADTREGSLNAAGFLLRGGYTVLAADSRGHGASGGMLGYGIFEAEDVHAWVDWMFRNAGIERVYGLGFSMGAAILIQALPREPRLRAIVADCPFSDFKSVAFDRLGQFTGLPRGLFWPVVNGGFAYARLRYGLDLGEASPATVVRGRHAPILLIHGLSDSNIPIEHSRRLHKLDPVNTQLWEVPHAEHVGSFAEAPAAYTQRVLAWFDFYR